MKSILKQKLFGAHYILLFIFGSLFITLPVFAQLETFENGGIVDKNTQKDDEQTDLDKSKYTPTGLSGAPQDDGSVRLQWSDKAKDEDGYKVQRRSSGGDWIGVADLDRGSEKYTDQSARRGETYSYRVRAYNESSETEYSSVVVVTTAPQDVEDFLTNDIVKDEIERVVALTAQEKDEIISNLESELRVANEDLQKSSEQLVETQACDITVIPEEQIQKEMESRCESFPGSQKINDTASKTGSLLTQIFSNTTARIVMSGLLLFVVLNNVWWHITHRSVRKELHYHKNK